MDPGGVAFIVLAAATTLLYVLLRRNDRRMKGVDELRREILDAAEAERGRVRFADRPFGQSKKIATGIDAARAALEELPLDPDPVAFLDRALVALEEARARVAREDDEDGWALGGLAWVRGRVEEARARAAKERSS